MPEEQRSIFTEKSRRKLKSVDDLERAAQAIGPSAWVTLVAVLALVCGLFAWGFFGTVPVSIKADGFYDSNLGLICVVSPDQAGRVSSGDPAVANDVPTKVREVLNLAYTKEELASLLESDYIAEQLGSNSTYNFLVFLDDADVESGFAGKVDVSITVDSPRPVDLVFGEVLGNA